MASILKKAFSHDQKWDQIPHTIPTISSYFCRDSQTGRESMQSQPKLSIQLSSFLFPLGPTRFPPLIFRCLPPLHSTPWTPDGQLIPPRSPLRVAHLACTLVAGCFFDCWIHCAPCYSSGCSSVLKVYFATETTCISFSQYGHSMSWPPSS